MESFDINGLRFYKLQRQQTEPLIDNLRQTCGVFRIPDAVCRTDLSNLPSPIKSNDFEAAYTSGLIPTTTAAFGSTVMDVLRRESKPSYLEPEFNVYRQFLLKDHNGLILISEPTKPTHHWATGEEIVQVYGPL